MALPWTPAALLWDMDGTLVDTEPYWIEAEFAVWRRTAGSGAGAAHALVGSDLLRAAAIIAERGRWRSHSPRSSRRSWRT